MKYVWDNSNIVESYPGVCSPLTFSFARYVYREVYRQAAALFGVPQKTIEAHYRELETFLGYFDGRFYYNLQTWCTLIAHLPGFSQNPALLQEMMGVRPGDRIEVPPVKISLFAKLRVLARFLYYHFALNGQTKKWVADFDASFRSTMAELEGITDPHEAMRFFFGLEDRYLRCWQIPILNDFAVMIYSGILRRLHLNYLERELDPALISQVGQAGNARMVVALRGIAREVARDPQLLKALAEPADPKAWQALTAHPEAGPLVRKFMSEFGLRNGQDLKLESPNLCEEPERFVDLVVQYVDRQPSHPEGVRRAREGITRLPYLKRLAMRFLVRHTRRSMARREEMRLKRSQIFGAVRQVFLIVGRYFVRQGLIECVDDIFYMEMDEVFQLLQGTATLQSVQVVVEQRKKELGGAEERDWPPHFATEGIPSLSGSPRDDGSVKAVVLELTGTPNYPAVVTGEVVVMEQADFSVDVKDRILVCKQTDPSWVPFLGLVKGLVVERGGLLSHAAIVSRELQVPSVIGVTGATSVLRSGQWVRLDAEAGRVVAL